MEYTAIGSTAAAAYRVEGPAPGGAADEGFPVQTAMDAASRRGGGTVQLAPERICCPGRSSFAAAWH